MRSALLFLLSVCIPVSAEAPAKTPVNVLIIYADEYRADCIGVAGNETIQTPNLDALARDGVLYRNSYCVWPVCTPSRISLMTGQYVKQHGGRSNRSTILPGTPTYATILRDAGYETSAVGKMHFTPAYQDVGFDTMLLSEQNGQGRNVDDYHRHLRDVGILNSKDLIDQERQYRKDAPQEYWDSFGAYVSDVPDEHHITTWTGDRAVERISNWTEKQGNLLMVGFLKPHHPFDPPAPWHERYDPEKTPILPGWTASVPKQDYRRARGYFDSAKLNPKALKKVTAYYYAIITHMDHHIGRIVQELKDKGLYDNTLIVFTADHGEYMGFHHMLLKGNYMYDPLVKVPLIIKYPEQRHAGIQTDELVNTLDVTSTVLSETEQRETVDMRGDALGGNTPGRVSPREVVIAEDRTGLMVTDGRYKLMLDRNDSQSQLFDLKEDPYELVNRIYDGTYASIIFSLKEAVLSWQLNETDRSVYVDTTVPLADGENVPRDLKSLELDQLEYFDTKVKAELRK
ncbi:sulfatase-like hydrolase/transferase [bacterium AH-315-P07]|nr:sulfatase-like hydrolase/transferase [bacterium AH-315-P07]